MYYLNKIVFVLCNPLGVTISLMLLAFSVKLFGLCWAKEPRRWYKVAWALVVGSAVWLMIWSMGIVHKTLGGWLETPYVVNDGEYWAPLAESAPNADAIVLLGGGMSCQTNGYPYADMGGPADRVWHAARLWKAGRAHKILATGPSVRASTHELLVDLGVPSEAVECLSSPRNTEEEAKCIAQFLIEGLKLRNPRILLVTSAWHMRRAELIFKKYASGLEVIPCPTDFVATMHVRAPLGITLMDFIPSPEYMMANAAMFKEMLGLVGYRVFR